MNARAAAAILIGLAAAACFQSPSAGSTSSQGSWTLRYVSPTSVDLELSYHDGGSSWDVGNTESSATAGLRGLTFDDVRTASGDKHFSIVRDAGTFDCNGYFVNGQGSGMFDFSPSASFADALEARGLGRPDDRDALDLALEDVSLAFVDRLKAAGIAGLSTSSLVLLASHGVSARTLDALNAAGVRPRSADDLVQLADHGVDADFVSALSRFGYHPGVQDLVRLRDHGVDPSFVGDLARLGYRPSADDLIRLRDHGVDGAFVQKLEAHGYKNLSVDDLIRLRDAGF